jgi:hypothetical protein
MDFLVRPDVQEALADLNISAGQRRRRVRNAGISIAYNVGVSNDTAITYHTVMLHYVHFAQLQALKTKLGQLGQAFAFFQLALRLELRNQADIGNRADALHAMALVASHSGAYSTRRHLTEIWLMICQAMALLAVAI